MGHYISAFVLQVPHRHTLPRREACDSLHRWPQTWIRCFWPCICTWCKIIYKGHAFLSSKSLSSAVINSVKCIIFFIFVSAHTVTTKPTLLKQFYINFKKKILSSKTRLLGRNEYINIGVSWYFKNLRWK